MKLLKPESIYTGKKQQINQSNKNAEINITFEA